MLTNAKAEFWMTKTSEIFHFCDILSQRLRIWKYASFEGVEIALNP